MMGAELRLSKPVMYAIGAVLAVYVYKKYL